MKTNLRSFEKFINTKLEGQHHSNTYLILMSRATLSKLEDDAATLSQLAPHPRISYYNTSSGIHIPIATWQGIKDGEFKLFKAEEL